MCCVESVPQSAGGKSVVVGVVDPAALHHQEEAGVMLLLGPGEEQLQIYLDIYTQLVIGATQDIYNLHVAG